uniref:Uncharacterized protein n=1 Tax=Quercus lobata TaxID=97700 RepID=A0A7N2N4Y6_QUELO
MQFDVSKTIKNASVKILDAFVDLVFEFDDQPLLPSQSNFAPVDELKETLLITDIEGKIPDSFPEGVFVRNGGCGSINSDKALLYHDFSYILVILTSTIS